ncbi:hypothetical protein F8O06_04950 [Pseudoclavibacter sp. CFCC 14310]|uniref:hypothetical protein n=1 Tax=Pseudoclavibacter sp. CFCC 14310 TaxID=2615180 RepID=UPI001300DBBF|nr:hypothetical protein [Pseudoclavibacter sp. CFCC 14310]KAB1645427.1 hypothetical protein F8O06_07495 [Pseudoclavibacter sp. CFCC 14310]KAB1646114.1 hypothetical protein F8O06_04950 [Pseudoclavibacter sp. CFCC 14310]
MPRKPRDPERTYAVVIDEYKTARLEADQLKEASKQANAKAAKLKAEANRLKKSAITRSERKVAEAKAELQRVLDLVNADD